MRDKSAIGARLREFAYSRGFKLTEFAKALGMIPQTLNSYLSGRIAPGSEVLMKLSDLGCNIEWLLTGKAGGTTDSTDSGEVDSRAELKEISKKDITTTSGSRNETDKKRELNFRVMGTVPAGVSDIQDWSELYEFKELKYDPDTHFYLKVDEEFGYSMMPMVSPGDYVLVSFYGKVKPGDLVVALYDKTKGALKIYTENASLPGIAMLTSYNQSIPPMLFKKDEIKMYKVVLIEKSGKA